VTDEALTIKERADAEAARAEAESPDEEAPEVAPESPVEPSPEEEEEGEAEQPPTAPEPPESLSGPQSEAEVEKVLKKLDNEAERHVKRVAEIMGDDYPEQRAWALTFPPDKYFPPDAAPFPPEHKEAVLGILGIQPGPEFAESPDAEPCETCKALGKTLTGSLVPEQRTKLCKDCQGAGWKPKAVIVGGTNLPPLNPEANGGETGGAATISIPDVWGRAPGHPHYGVPPAQVGV
jgi:hypothetical protein